MNCAPKLGRPKYRLRRKGLAPELLRGQSPQFNLAPPRVPMDDVGVEVRLEGLEVGPRPSPEELVLDVPEDLLGGAVVDAVPLPRHALGDPGRPQSLRPAGMLVLPAHVAVQDRPRVPGHPLQQPVEQELLLIHVGARRCGPGHDLLAAEVVHRREVGLAPGLLELRDVGAHLLPRRAGGEVAPYGVLEGLADDAPVGVVAVVVGLAAYPAADAHLAHHLEHGLVGDPLAQLGAQAHGHLPVAAAVRGAREDFRDRAAQLGPGGPGRVSKGVVVGRSPEPRALQQVAQGMPLGAQGRDRLGLRPGQSPSLSTRARNFFR